jgi:hypothetical protein
MGYCTSYLRISAGKEPETRLLYSKRITPLKINKNSNIS